MRRTLLSPAGMVPAFAAFSLIVSACALINTSDFTSGSAGADSGTHGDAQGTTSSSSSSGGSTTSSSTSSTSSSSSSGDGAVGTSDGATTNNAYAQAVLADKPALYYRFEDNGAASTVKDETGTHDSALVPGGSLGAPGAFAGSKALGLKGDNGGGVHVGDGFDFDALKPFTLEAWYRADQYDDTYRFLFCNDNKDANGRQEYGVFVQDMDGLAIERWVNDSGRNADMQPAPSVATWHHVASTYDGQMLRLYVDGFDVEHSIDNRAAVVKTTGLWVGTSKDGASLIGAIDEAAIYTTALTADRVLAHFTAAK